jgi:DNA anti-recombination protein RmuC
MTTTTDLAAASREFMATSTQLATLVDLDAASVALWVLLTEVEDDTWSPEERADLEAKLEYVTEQQLHKVESYIGLLKKIEALAEYDDAEATRLKERRDRKRRAVDRLKARLLEHLKRTNQERVETIRYTVALRTNPPAVSVLEAQLVPKEYERTRIEVSVDKRAILDHYKATGEIPPGVEITRGQSLRIS